MNLITTSQLPAQREEQRIIWRLLRQQERPTNLDVRSRADRVIGLVATIVAVAVLGSVLQELMWAALAGGSIVALGVR